MDRELSTEIVKSGTWLYDNAILHEVWIVKQNFEYHYEEDYADGPEQLNSDGETFAVVYSRDGSVSALGPERFSIEEGNCCGRIDNSGDHLDEPKAAAAIRRQVLFDNGGLDGR